MTIDNFSDINCPLNKIAKYFFLFKKKCIQVKLLKNANVIGFDETKTISLILA